MLNVVDEFTHECLAIRVDRKLKAIDVIDVLSDLFILRGVPGHIRSDNGPEFVAKAVQTWITAVGPRQRTLSQGHLGRTAMWSRLTPGSELLEELFYTLRRPRSSSRAGDDITTLHRNTHLAMSLAGRGFVDRDAIPCGIWGSSWLAP